MTINNPERFDQARPAGFDGVFEWDFLNGCFPRRIMPMDFDAVIEIGNHFLVFETKEAGKPVPEGQKRTFTSLLANQAFTIFMVYGKTAESIARLVVCHGADRRDINPATVEDVRYEATKWATKAEKYPRIPLNLNERRAVFINAKSALVGLTALYDNDDFVADLGDDYGR